MYKITSLILFIRSFIKNMNYLIFIIVCIYVTTNIIIIQCHVHVYNYHKKIVLTTRQINLSTHRS